MNTIQTFTSEDIQLLQDRLLEDSGIIHDGFVEQTEKEYGWGYWGEDE